MSELIELQFFGFYGVLEGVKFRTSWLAQGAELDMMKAFGRYLIESGWLDD